MNFVKSTDSWTRNSPISTIYI